MNDAPGVMYQGTQKVVERRRLYGCVPDAFGKEQEHSPSYRIEGEKITIECVRCKWEVTKETWDNMRKEDKANIHDWIGND